MMIKAKNLDVTQIEPRLKHPTIFEHFDALTTGESFTILNDHDPKPLYYQLLGERGNIFTWEYLESGPTQWRVEIAKPIDAHAITVGQIAAKDFRKAEVFKKLGIDFCCGGNKSLKEAISEKGLDEQAVIKALDEVHPSLENSKNHDFNSWSLTFLSDYLLNVHHRYIREAGPIIEQLADKVAHRHGAQQPQLFELAKEVHFLMEDLYSHLEHEEVKLFPFIKDLENNQRADVISNEVLEVLNDEHQSAGEDLLKWRKLTNNYTLPTDSCNSHTYLYDKIKEFESDLFEHIHLENNILFPKTRQLLN